MVCLQKEKNKSVSGEINKGHSKELILIALALVLILVAVWVYEKRIRQIENSIKPHLQLKETTALLNGPKLILITFYLNKIKHIKNEKNLYRLLHADCLQ